MKKFLAIVLTVAMLFAMGATAFAAEEAKADAAKPAVVEPGEGEETKRPNDSASVVKYFEGKDKRMWAYFEAEDAEVIDGAKVNSDHEGYNGTGCVAMTCWKTNPDATPGIKFTVNAVVAGAQDIYIGYDNGHAWAQSANLTVNGAAAQKIYFPTVQKDVWAAYGMIKVNVTLNEGANTIVLQYDKADYPSSFNVDFIAASKGDTWKDEASAIKLTIGNNTITKVTENGEVPVQFDVAPIIKDGRTFVPVRGIFEIAGATIEWNGDTRAATVKTDKATVIVTIDNKQARVNGRRVMMDAPPFIQDGRTLIPLRFISENLGYKVDWNGETQTVTINLFD